MRLFTMYVTGPRVGREFPRPTLDSPSHMSDDRPWFCEPAQVGETNR